jgi:hypothetical protein
VLSPICSSSSIRAEWRGIGSRVTDPLAHGVWITASAAEGRKERRCEWVCVCLRVY